MTRQLFLLSAVLILPLLLAAALIFVISVQAGSPDICASDCTYGSIQEAVNDDSTVGSTLVLAAESFSENVEITRSISLVGAGPTLTFIDGQLADTVILIGAGADVSISGVTIRNGDAAVGGGIMNNGTLSLDNVIVRDSVATELSCGIATCIGGGIANSAVLTISNSSLISNTAEFGGGIHNALNATTTATNVTIEQNTASGSVGDPSAGGGVENLGTMTLSNSTVRDNDAPFGAGIVNAGTMTVSGSDIYGNMADTQGGGFHNSFNLTIQTSNIYDNEAGSGGGGGLSSEGGTVIVEQTAVYGNEATGSGGGIVHNVTAGANSFTLTNSTVSGNSTTGAGGGIRNAGIANTSLNNVTVQNNQAIVASGQSISVLAGTLTAKNSIIATNQSGANCSGAISSQGYNIADDNSCSLTGTADLPNTNPQLGPLQNNGGSTLTHALIVGSPAIDSGSGCSAVDQRGVSRPVGATCDRGAYEFDGTFESVYLPFVVRP